MPRVTVREGCVGSFKLSPVFAVRVHSLPFSRDVQRTHQGSAWLLSFWLVCQSLACPTPNLNIRLADSLDFYVLATKLLLILTMHRAFFSTLSSKLSESPLQQIIGFHVFPPWWNWHIIWVGEGGWQHPQTKCYRFPLFIPDTNKFTVFSVYYVTSVSSQSSGMIVFNFYCCLAFIVAFYGKALLGSVFSLTTSPIFSHYIYFF